MTSPADEPRELGADVAELVAAIKRAVAATGITGPASVLEIVRMTVRLTVVATTTQGTGIRFRVPWAGVDAGAGAGSEESATQTIELTLLPPEPTGVRAGPGTVAAAIRDAVRWFARTAEEAEGGNEPWRLENGKVEIGFDVQANGSVSLWVDRGHSRADSNVLTIEVRPRAPRSAG